jgi:hypothetical protein
MKQNNPSIGTIGGKRPGAGRKPILDAKKSVNIMLKPSLVQRIDESAKKYRQSRSTTIERLVESGLSLD